MASKKQIVANRANAKRSTGPKTPAGKCKSSRNALKHGLCSSSDIVIWDEDPLEFEKLQAELEEVYPPVNALVRELVHHLAEMLWRIRRASNLEAAALGSSFKDTLTYIFQLADPATRKKVLERLRQLQRARRHGEGGEIGFDADFGQALCRELPDVMAAVMEAEMAEEPDRRLAAIARHETSLRNGISRTLAMLHALGAAQPAQKPT
jgi:hypothetical protein